MTSPSRDMNPFREIEMVWECPECGMQLAHMTGDEVRIPVCDTEHDPVEMEQRLAFRWGVPADTER